MGLPNEAAKAIPTIPPPTIAMSCCGLSPVEFALLSYKSFIKSDYQLVQNHIQCPTLANKQGSCCPKHDELHTTWTKEDFGDVNIHNKNI